MSTTAGSFDETILLNQRVLADRISLDDRIMLQFKPQYDVIKAIQAAQTATILTPLARRKEVTVEVMWENFCDIVATSCATDCTLGGPKSSTNVKTYDVTFCKEVGFSMNEDDFIDNEFDMNVAKALLKADKEITEAFAAYAVAQIEAFKGTNVLTTGKGTVAGTETTIPAAYWTSAIVPYLSRVALMNQMTSPIFLSGSLLWEQYQLSQAMALNADGKGDFKLWGSLNPFWDMWNIDTVNTPDLKAYLISMGSIAMGNKFENPNVPQQMHDFMRYTMPSRFLPGMTYDVFYNNSCVGTDKRVLHNYTIRFKGDVWQNPTGCNGTNTGILSFKCL